MYFPSDRLLLKRPQRLQEGLKGESLLHVNLPDQIALAPRDRECPHKRALECHRLMVPRMCVDMDRAVPPIVWSTPLDVFLIDQIKDRLQVLTGIPVIHLDGGCLR